MKTLGQLLASLGCWFLNEWKTDLRSALYSALVAAAPIGLVVSIVLADETPKSAELGVNELGMTQPAQLFADANNESIGSISFEPSAIRRTKVCGYFFRRADTFFELAVSYLKEYEACFNIVPLGPTTISVHGTEQLKENNGSYYCNCPTQSIELDSGG